MLSIFYNCQNLEYVDLTNYDNLLAPNLRRLFLRTNINQTNIKNIVKTKDNKDLNTKEINFLLGINED